MRQIVVAVRDENGLDIRGLGAAIERGDAVIVSQDLAETQVPPKPGIGDMVASALSAVGITKERVSKAIGKPCGCAKRQEKLNELGRKFGIG